MKNKLKIIYLLLTITTLSSCSVDEYKISPSSMSITNNLDNLSNKITLKSSTENVSVLFYNLGVSKINTINKNNQKTITLKTLKSFNFRGNSINMSNFSVKVKGKLIILNQDDRYKMGIVNDKAYLITPSYSGLYENADIETLKDINSFILIAFLDELTNTGNTLNQKTELSNKGRGGCSFWDQGFSVGVGLNSTSALADLGASMAGDIASGATNGCTKIGSPQAVAWSNETVWVQAWCCQ